MRGKKTSQRIKEKVAAKAIELSLRDNVPIDEISKREVARVSNMPKATTDLIMNSEEFDQFVQNSKQKFAHKYTLILDKIAEDINKDLDSGKFSASNAISKYTAFGVTADKLGQLIGKDDSRVNFTQNIVNVSEEITKILARTHESSNDEKTP